LLVNVILTLIKCDVVKVIVILALLVTPKSNLYIAKKSLFCFSFLSIGELCVACIYVCTMGLTIHNWTIIDHGFAFVYFAPSYRDGP
jgi:hypothetical protein